MIFKKISCLLCINNITNFLQTVFGLISLFGALAASVLVETKHHQLMMTFHEAEKFYQQQLSGSLAQKIFKLPKKLVSLGNLGMVFMLFQTLFMFL